MLKYVQKYEGGRADVRVELVNVWGIENWGLDPAGFAELLRSAHDRDRGLFLPTLETPYLSWLLRPENLDRDRFRPFPLDERRYVYRLVTGGEEKALAPELPRDPVLVVGQRVGSAGVVVRTEFSGSEAIAGELRFQRNGEPILFRLEWTAPGGERWSGDEVQVPFGCVTAWSLLDAPRPLAPGAWSVEARSGTTRLGETRFTVRPTSSQDARPPSGGLARDVRYGRGRASRGGSRSPVSSSSKRSRRPSAETSWTKERVNHERSRSAPLSAEPTRSRSDTVMCDRRTRPSRATSSRRSDPGNASSGLSTPCRSTTLSQGLPEGRPRLK